MATFRNLNDLFSHLQQKVIPDIMENEAYETIVEAESRMVEEHVYDAYTPTENAYSYERRGRKGGLADPSNHIASFFYKGVNQVEMLVQNTTTGKNETDFKIAGLVEYGHDNGYGSYQYPYNSRGDAEDFLRARPFTYETIQELKRTLDHVTAFKRGLRRHGIRTYK